ncbi:MULTISPECIES: oligosaccharide flippase family protein [Thalassospira]|uniref:Polysaccharide biosynthesis protein C-terminal domain-containing protein n=2 Tax=Thalassospira TaxID=168934 RepID=A0A367W1S1_9PROT|nr:MULTISPECIES: oligosaccharide flippase family protein [Thalassospira]MDG4720121.1 oligosaccharide flippase family protein [Thalassospira sp. FZY0004]RCK31760.1 hypothetical protein TH19_20280 [Thalassospira profundimaris]
MLAFTNSFIRKLPFKMVQNVGALTIVQITNYLVQLVSLPWLTRHLGNEGWGHYAWTLVIVEYFTILINWSFSLHGVRKIAILQTDRTALSRVFCAGWTIQLGLVLLSTLVWGCLLTAVPFFESFSPYTLPVTAQIFATALFPVWLLVGIERMKDIAAIQILISISSLPLILLLVDDPHDGPLAMGIVAGCKIAGAIVAIMWIVQQKIILWQWPTRNDLRVEFLESGSLFISRVAVALYTILIPTLLGTLAGTIMVGYYVLADRIRKIITLILDPLSQSLAPRISHLFAHDAVRAWKQLRFYAALVLMISGAGSIVLWLCAEKIVSLIASDGFTETVILLTWFAPLPLITNISLILSRQLLIPFGLYKIINGVTLIAAFLSLTIAIPLITLYGAKGAVMTVLTVETWITTAMGIMAWWKISHMKTLPLSPNRPRTPNTAMEQVNVTRSVRR